MHTNVALIAVRHTFVNMDNAGKHTRRYPSSYAGADVLRYIFC